MTLATGAGTAGGSPAITAILAGKTQKEERFESRNPYGHHCQSGSQLFVGAVRGVSWIALISPWILMSVNGQDSTGVQGRCK